jgi:hypothetical protein
MATPHRIIHPPEELEVPKAPVRDDDAVGDHEDLDRQPDGVPHEIVGYTALFAVVLAMLIAVVFVSGGHVAGIALAILAVPVIVKTLNRKADERRDHQHPSR